MKRVIDRTCDSVRTSLLASARLVTVGSKAARTTYLRPNGRNSNREVAAMTTSIKGGQRVRLDVRSNTGELSKVSSKPKEPKMLTGSSQKASQLVTPSVSWSTRIARLPVYRQGLTHPLLLKQNTVANAHIKMTH